ncbi:hypothetical protein B6U91_01495 [Candidatus Pacearchaeota archaeon ex4484_71]|nr:MAG: hypothetical protein B6U91_01495 [Candidatus Pacearchaeota archaeon ex4484_71]
MVKKRYKIYLFRHGRTDYNVRGLFTGRRHTFLTSEGRRDAQRVARKLKGKKIDVAFRSSLPRSKETLDYVLEFHPECKRIIVDDRIIERSYGVLEGTSHEDFIKTVGGELYKIHLKEGLFKGLGSLKEEEIKRFFGEREYEAIHRGYEVSAVGGESFLDVEKRVRDFIKYLKKYVCKSKVNVAISAHGNSIRLFRKVFENASREKAQKWFIHYDEVFEYSVLC